MNDIDKNKGDSESPSPLKALLMLIGIVVFVGLFITLNSLIGIHDFWAGFLFILYWSGVEEMKVERLPHCIIGAVVGLLIAYGLQMLPQKFGPYGILIPLAAIFVIIYCQLMAWVSVAVNTATMLFLTVATIPTLQSNVDFLSIFGGFGLGVIFFVTLMIVVPRLAVKVFDS
tara:strand:- start:1150 stop:1665 length:516 start_codon:yes stop_codon:yes gene_type:complete